MKSPSRSLAVALAAALAASAGAKLTDDQKIEILRGMTAEFATVKTYLPRSKKPLPFDASGAWDKKKWEEIGRELGPAARVGDLVQITRVAIEGDRILFEINNGVKKKGHWYDHVEIGMGTRTSPVSNPADATAATGTNIALEFHKPVPALGATDIKKLLAPVLDFEKHSATENYVEKLPPEIQKAIKTNKAIEGMDHDQVLLAMGKPRQKQRETRDGAELEDWVYGEPPGKITFVTFQGSKVVKVKEAYAGLGGSTAPPLPSR